MDDPTRSTPSSQHNHFAGRVAAGSEQPVILSKNGIRHRRRLPTGEEQEILSIGLACSECFHGERLAKLLKPGFEYEQKAMQELLMGNSASPLSLHTSGGVTHALSEFIEALAPHVPWKDADELDWCVSLQLEGASAVWAAIDMVLQESILVSGNKKRKMVAVGSTSYHGPPSTSFGAKCPLWQKGYQLKYPVPIAGEKIDEAKYVAAFQDFLNQHGEEVGVILFEPQWGSSQAAFPWPKSMLKKYIAMAKANDIRVVCDEIMCGLGRHGNGSIFISKDWELDPDAVTFGKAMGGGVYPVSGAILKRGRDTLARNGCSVMQSHTYAGSSVRSLMTATAVLKELPLWIPSIQKLGEEMEHIFGYLQRKSNGMLVCHGQGLMWGGLFTQEGKMKDPAYKSRAIKCFRKHCEQVGVLPYIVPAGGFMVTPVVDIDVGTVYEIGERMEKVLDLTMQEMEWSIEEEKQCFEIGGPTELDEVVANLLIQSIDLSKCQIRLHETRSCTSCTKFVSPDVRLRFMQTGM
mmetsp:Transcript_469/g.1075  ORF Transcript_469/g.1075 Transcript_469/m.1075 type:complete len:520 (+) Transcript_469:867-2426(+)